MIIYALVVIVLICFTSVVFFGAPYLPTLTPQVDVAIKLSALKPGQTLLELGCGDGKVVVAAAKQGIVVIGYELNPLLVVVAKLRTFKYRKTVRIIWGNFWKKSWPPADAIFVFLLPKYMSKLNNKCIQYSHKPVKLVSFAFEIPNKQESAKQNSVFLYKYL